MMRAFTCMLAGLLLLVDGVFAQQASAQNPSPGYPRLTWKFVTAAPINSSPIVEGNRVYFGGFDSVFRCLGVAEGKEIWSVRTQGEIRSTAAMAGERVIFLSGDGFTYCLNKGNGALIWKFASKGERKQDFADYYQSSPLIVDKQVYCGSGDGNVYALRLSDGEKVWSFPTGGVVHARPVASGDELFVGSFDGYFYALSITTGAVLWKFKSVGQQWFPRGEFSGSPVVANGLVIVGARDYNLYALDAEKGYCHWNRRFSRGWALPNTVVDSVLYTGTSDNRLLIASEAATGREIWKSNLHFNIFGGIAISESYGYVGTLLGKMYAIDLKSGAEIWSFATDGYNANHLKYFKEDDSFRDDIFEIVKSDEAFIEVEHEIGAVFSTPAIDGDFLISTSTDGSVYCLKLK